MMKHLKENIDINFFLHWGEQCIINRANNLNNIIVVLVESKEPDLFQIWRRPFYQTSYVSFQFMDINNPTDTELLLAETLLTEEYYAILQSLMSVIRES